MKHSRYIRRKAFEERKSLQQLVLSILGIISLLFLFFYIGIPSLVKLSSLIAGFKKDITTVQNENNVISEPFLEPLPVATNSAKITISGSANTGETVLLFLNNDKTAEKLVGKDGQFAFTNISLDTGTNDIYAIAKLNDKESLPSQKLKVSYQNEPPKLEVESPKDGEVFKRENKEILIKGKTDEEAIVSVNDRLIIVDPNGNFSTTLRLNDGENKLEIKAADNAGNSQKVDLKVIYEP